MAVQRILHILYKKRYGVKGMLTVIDKTKSVVYTTGKQLYLFGICEIRTRGDFVMKRRLPAWSILLLICIVVGGALGMVNSLTEGPIAQRAIEKANAARQVSFAAADSFEEVEVDAASGLDACYTALSGGQPVGYVAQITVTGFGGPVEITVGMDLDKTITGISVGGSKFAETPGLGAKAKDAAFTEQYQGQSVPVSLGSGVDAITGATITSAAVNGGVNKAGLAMLDLISPAAEDNRPEDLHFGGILPGATTKEQAEAPEGVDELYLSDAGVVLYVTGKGRNGDMQVRVGVGHSGQVAGVFVDPEKQSETPGLVDMVLAPFFSNQFIGKTGAFAIGDNIDAVSGATITSEAVVAIVNRAVEAAQPYLDPSKAVNIETMESDPADAVASATADAGSSATADAGSSATADASSSATTDAATSATADAASSATGEADAATSATGETDAATSATADAASSATGTATRTAQVVETGTGVTVLSAADWAEKYPEIYASYMLNSENKDVIDHVEEYPMISALYEGMAFNKFYASARGHVYTVEDVTATGRPHALANCFSCKTPDFTAKVNELGDAAYTMKFEDMLAEVNESISCYNCHANTGDQLVVTHTYVADALGEDLQKVDAANLSCAQCHVEYYFDPVSKATTLPYSGLETMNPDDILEFFNTTMVDGKPFADYTNPRTGVRQIKVQHPEFETYMGEGSVHKGSFTCADCHMGKVTENGKTYTSHTWVSPLESETIMASCAHCHADLTAEVRAIQEETERRTYAIGYELEALTEKLVKAVESGEYTEEELNAIRAVARDAQFYWDFVFVENSEGAHNSKLTEDCLNKAETLANKAMAMFK